MQYDEKEAIRLTQELVRIESTNVGTFEGEVSQFIYNWLKDNTEAEITRDEFEPGRFNVMATIKGKVAHPNFLCLAHMDTVPVGEGWTKDPFGAEIEGNKMYGRGACDMKAGVAIAMLVFRDIENYCRKENVIPNMDFTFVATGDEEDVMKGADRLVELKIADKDTLVLDTEPTNGEIMMGHKGKTWFEITTKGKPAHGSMPSTGIDAIIAMAEVILEIRNRIDAFEPDAVMGKPSVCFGTIHGGNNTNIVAESCTITIDMRLSPPLTTEGSYKLIEDAIAAGTARVPGASGTYKVIAKRPYVLINEESVLLKNLQESCLVITGRKPEPSVTTAYTDSGVVDGSTGCGNGMSYGVNGGNFHQADEYVDCDTILQAYDVVFDLAKRLLL